MYKVHWSTVAVSDLDSIYNYIGQYSAAYASIFISKIFQAIETLIKFPLSGRVVPEFDLDRMREVLIFKNYRLIYQITDKKIEIIAIHHQSRKIV